MPCYSILVWFTLEILDKAGLSEQKGQLIEYVAQNILTTASRLQFGKETSSRFQQEGIDAVGRELIKCVSGLSKTEVLSFINPNTKFRNKKAFGIKLDRTPKLSDTTKHNIFAMAKSSSEIGEHNVPRCFMIEGSKKKQEKCTILVCDAFSEEIRNTMVDSGIISEDNRVPTTPRISEPSSDHSQKLTNTAETDHSQPLRDGSLDMREPARTDHPPEPLPDRSLDMREPAQTDHPPEPLPDRSLDMREPARTDHPPEPLPEPLPDRSLDMREPAQTDHPPGPVPDRSLDMREPARTDHPSLTARWT